jgi:hypothetical protein
MIGHRSRRPAIAFVLILLVFSTVVVFSSWVFMTTKLTLARSEGVYPSAERGMRARLDRAYVGISRVDILYAGPNSFDGSQPHVWYVIAEVRASMRSGGYEMGVNGCDAPGSFFLETTDGWVHVPEGAFPEIVGFWMKVFGLAGPGQAAPSTDWAPSQPKRFCQSG